MRAREGREETEIGCSGGKVKGSRKVWGADVECW